MALSIIQTADKLRFITDSSSVVAVFDAISDDSISINEAEADIEIVVPVYGSVYLRFTNPIGKHYTTGQVSLEGVSTEFDKVVALTDLGGVQPVSLVIGGTGFAQRVLFRGIVTGVTTKRSLLRPDTWITGQVSFIKL